MSVPLNISTSDTAMNIIMYFLKANHTIVSLTMSLPLMSTAVAFSFILVNMESYNWYPPSVLSALSIFRSLYIYSLCY